MRVLVVSGIWPPDVGGPASHAPEVASYLRSRGHAVEAVVTADARPAPEEYPVRFTPRSLPPGLRHAHAAALVARRARAADVVYTTGMFVRSAAGAAVARRPYVLKLTGDPAFERARWRGIVETEVNAFQDARAGAQVALLRRLRDATVRRAAHVFCPSAYLRDLAVAWGAEPERVEVLPNPAPVGLELRPREELRRSFGFDGTTIVFAGRLTAQKSLGLALEAVEQTEGVRLAIAGDGAEREALEAQAGPRVRFLGPLPRKRVLELFAAADAAILPSSWENFPHTVVEALAVGTPVLAARVGGVAEVVQDGLNGLLVPPDDVDALTAALQRLVRDEELRARLREAAAPSVTRYAPERLYARLEDALARAGRG